MGVCVRVQTCAALGPGGVLCAQRVKGSGALTCQLVLLAPSQVIAYSVPKQTCCNNNNNSHNAFQLMMS